MATSFNLGEVVSVIIGSIFLPFLPETPIQPNHKNNANTKKFIAEFNRLVKKYGMENNVILQSFDWGTLIEMKKQNPNISLSALYCQQPSWGRDSEYLRAWEK